MRRRTMRGRMIRPEQGAWAALAFGSPATPASGVLASAIGYPSLSCAVNSTLQSVVV